MINKIIDDYKNLDSDTKELVNICSCFGIALVIGIFIETLTIIF